MECEHVYKDVVFIEENVCKTGMHDMLALTQLYFWQSLVVLLVAVGVNRLKPIVDKKKYQFEVL